jgi:hypothetical protein
MDSGALFTGDDLRIIESLIFDASLKPMFDPMRDCLAWADERADGLTREGYERLCDLLIARSFIHRNLDFSTHTLDPAYFREIWERAMKHKFRWPGFNRLELSADDRSFFEKELSNSQNDELSL